MSYDFESEVEKVFEREGYWTDDPDDPGGLTIWGISARSYPDDVAIMKDMDRETARTWAKNIYYRDFWSMCGAEHLANEGLGLTAMQVFDLSITSSVMTAVKLLQQALNGLGGSGYKWSPLVLDGGFGPRTLSAVRAHYNYNRANSNRPLLLARAYQAERAAYYLMLSREHGRGKHVDGWLNRAYDFILK